MTILDVSVKENAAKLAIELAKTKSVTLGSLNGTTNAWDDLTVPTPEMVIALAGSPPGGHWETEIIKPALEMERDSDFHERITLGPVVNIYWVANPPIPAQPYVPSIPPAEIAAMTSSNSNEAILPPAAGYKVVAVPITKKTIDFQTTEKVSHKVTMIPYMRQTLIEFVVDGLRPFARHYISFDDTRVDQYSTSVDNPYTFGNKLVADATGQLVGIIRIPPNTFKCGEHTIKVSDANLDSDIEISLAKAYFIAKGSLDVVTTTYKTTKVVTTRRSIDYQYEQLPPPPKVVPKVVVKKRKISTSSC